MGLFKRKQPSASFSLSGDDQVLEQLAHLGADDQAPRLVEHFVYCDDEAGAAVLETGATAAGWSVDRVVREYHGIVAKRSDLPVNVRSVSEAREFFERLAASVPGGDYDGWGAEGD
ncbi:MAG: ribonuclease E inhibitor RraB [Candidatus Saccharibacteria bacterium]|nr:ribonuclease E inhibitor RraB [Microbacteriaceae bacterium]